MFATMENANGIGLAAPQIGLGIRLFIIDSSPLAEDEESKTTVEAVRKVFINPQIMREEGKEWFGCSVQTAVNAILGSGHVLYVDPQFAPVADPHARARKRAEAMAK